MTELQKETPDTTDIEKKEQTSSQKEEEIKASEGEKDGGGGEKKTKSINIEETKEKTEEEKTKEEEKEKEEKKEGDEQDDEEMEEEENKASEDDDSKYEKMSAEEILEEGKRIFRMKDFEKAADVFSRATEKKMEENKGMDAYDGEMAEYYLWYGDALLTKEENKNELFDFSAQGELNVIAKPEKAKEEKEEGEREGKEDAGDSQSNAEMNEQNETESSNVADEQLAFEILEMARKSYLRRFDLQKKKEREKNNESNEKKKEEEEYKMISKEDLMDLSYVHIRLGDIQLLNEFYKEAADEYSEACRIRKGSMVRLGRHALISPCVSLAQSTMFAGEKPKALTFFQEALSLVSEELSAYDREEKQKNENAEDYQKLKETEEDLNIQIEELRKKIEEEEQSGKINTEKGCQYDVKSYMPSTTSTFDKPRLADGGEVPIKRIEIDTRKTKRKEELENETKQENKANEGSNDDSHGEQQNAEIDDERIRTSKKRRIDLTKFTQENHNNSNGDGGNITNTVNGTNVTPTTVQNAS